MLIKLPFRLLVKWLTSFSYLTIKIAAVCASQMVDVIDYDFEINSFYHDIFETYLQCITSYYFTSLLSDVKFRKIYFNFDEIFITFNPPQTDVAKLEKVFRGLPQILAEIELSTLNLLPVSVRLRNIENFESNKIYLGTVIPHKNGDRTLLVQTDNSKSIRFPDGSE